MSSDQRAAAGPQIRSADQAYEPGKPIEEVQRELGLATLKLASNEIPGSQGRSRQFPAGTQLHIP